MTKVEKKKQQPISQPASQPASNRTEKNEANSRKVKTKEKKSYIRERKGIVWRKEVFKFNNTSHK